MDFSQINEEEVQTAGSAGGGFKNLPPVEGTALLRLFSVVEYGDTVHTYTPKGSKPEEKQGSRVRLTFELVHPKHAIRKKADSDPADGPFTGDFIRNHTVSVTLKTKSMNERSAYCKLFNKMNYDGAVATPKGKVPSFSSFLGKAFLGKIFVNRPDPDGDKFYVNLDKDGEYHIGRAAMPKLGDDGMPTDEMTDIPVPEMTNEQQCFLWETGVSDEVYRAMWDSIEITGEKKDGTPFKNYIQEDIMDPEKNLGWAGSRAEQLFGAAAELDLPETVVTNTDDAPFDLDSVPTDAPEPASQADLDAQSDNVSNEEALKALGL